MAQDEHAAFETLKHSHLPWRLSGARNAKMERATFEGSWSIACEIGPMHGKRERTELANTPGEFIALLSVTRGREVIRQFGRTTAVDAGQAVFWDGVRPVECETRGSLKKRTTFFHRDALLKIFPTLNNACGVLVPRSGRLDVLTSWLEAASKSAAHEDGLPGEAFERVSVELLRTVFEAGSSLVARSPQSQLFEAKWFIRRHALDYELSTEGVAQALNMSVRSLHELFRDEPNGPGALIRKERLNWARQQLLGDLLTDIGAVGASIGYSTPSAFSRAFKQEFGVSPTDDRRLSLVTSSAV